MRRSLEVLEFIEIPWEMCHHWGIWYFHDEAIPLKRIRYTMFAFVAINAFHFQRVSINPKLFHRQTNSEL